MNMHSYATENEPHCKENPICVLLEMKLRGLSPNFHIHVSVRDLYIEFNVQYSLYVPMHAHATV